MLVASGRRGTGTGLLGGDQFRRFGPDSFLLTRASGNRGSARPALRLRPSPANLSTAEDTRRTRAAKLALATRPDRWPRLGTSARIHRTSPLRAAPEGCGGTAEYRRRAGRRRGATTPPTRPDGDAQQASSRWIRAQGERVIDASVGDPGGRHFLRRGRLRAGGERWRSRCGGSARWRPGR